MATPPCSIPKLRLAALQVWRERGFAIEEEPVDVKHLDLVPIQRSDFIQTELGPKLLPWETLWVDALLPCRKKNTENRKLMHHLIKQMRARSDLDMMRRVYLYAVRQDFEPISNMNQEHASLREFVMALSDDAAHIFTFNCLVRVVCGCKWKYPFTRQKLIRKIFKKY